MERFVTTPSGIRLWVETIGDPGAPPLLLIMGGMAQAIMWPEAFCRELADAGHLVVRYDHRDTGRSSTVDAARHPYSLADLTDDAAEIIRQVGGGPAHVVGQSVGGMVAQLLALDFAELVRSLVLVGTSSDSCSDLRRPPRGGLPGVADEMIAFARAVEQDPPGTPEAMFEAQLTSWRVLVGPHAPFDEDAWRDVLCRAQRRRQGPDTAGNHAGALDASPSRAHRLGRIAVPTLVVHGRRDPLFPVEHGRELAREIPGARLAEIDGLGHVFPPQWMPVLRDLILGHTSPGSGAPPGSAPYRRAAAKVTMNGTC
ncbi:alpha/beta fold hydrolase [Krasilnikovia sp. M28-CT-15]|uniref:alpha/beta fold hydrolase n=1 Tax=Krasilnikovia sp. M28-CT-15 TaxID=3373540 RepID=UPI003876B6B2